MTVVITRLFDTYDNAAASVAELLADGISRDDVSLVAHESAADANTVADTGEIASGAATGATLGTVLGGGAGLLAGIGMLAIPGIGPVVAAGWLVATAVGAGVGAGAGSLLGSLIGAGVQEDDAHVYAEGVRRGGTLVTVRIPSERRMEVETIFAQHSPVDPLVRGDAYRAEGWDRFNPSVDQTLAGGGIFDPAGPPSTDPIRRSTLL